MILTLLAAALIAAAHAAPLASTATPAWVAAPDGVVGVQETITVHAPALRGRVVDVDLATTGLIQRGQVALNAAGDASMPWTPALPGRWTVAVAGGPASALTATAMPTVTSLSAPSVVANGQPASFTTTVTTLGGSIGPSGTVALVDPTGATVTTAALGPASGTQATATLTWTPTGSPVPLRAVYTPATAAFAGSTSGTQAPALGDATLAVQFPDTLYAGVPVTLQAITGAGVPGGSAAFTLSIDGFGFFIAGSHPVVGGVATQRWAPGQKGYQTIGATFTSSTGAVNGVAQQAVFVQPAPVADTVTITAGGAAWPSTLAAGSSTPLLATAVSHAPVSLSASGPCVIEGAVLRAVGPGTCTVTAQSLGNGGSLTAGTTAVIASVG